MDGTEEFGAKQRTKRLEQQPLRVSLARVEQMHCVTREGLRQEPALIISRIIVLLP